MANKNATCPKCKERIDPTAKRCKHCQADLRNWFVKHKIMTGGFVFLLIVIVAVASGGNSDSSSNSSSSSSANSDSEASEVVSTSFDDYKTYCDQNATTLQKETEFKEKFENKYVKWTGTVERVDKGSLQVKHCDSTFTSDVVVTMRDDQNDELIKLRQGDKITYQAKMTRYGEILGLSASDGVIIKK